MYALVESGSITKIFTSPKGFVLNNNQYPQDIFYKWTKDEKEAIGIYEVETDSTNRKDEEWYINTNESYAFDSGKVIRSWGTATPKQLNDEDAKDNDGNNLLDEDGNQVINHGLKTEKKRIVKQQASGLLNPTDWYVIKATEVESYNVPENITNFRTEVRTTSNEMETKIDACNSVDELKSLYEYTEQEDGSITRPLGEFPVLEA
jgi:hypothetical protein